MKREYIELSDNQIDSLLSGEIVRELIQVNKETVTVEISGMRNFNESFIVDYKYDLNKNEKIWHEHFI